jgi:tetrahydromethanopterin S-methyltransferase subunit F
MFKWLNKPLTDAIDSLVKPASIVGTRVVQISGTTEEQRRTSVDDIATSSTVIARKRQLRSGLLPYGVAAVLALISTFFIASISRRLSSASTFEWMTSVVLSLVLKWGIMDPLKVLILAPLNAHKQRHPKKMTMLACLNACCTGSSKPHRFRDVAKHVVQAQTALRRAQIRLLHERIESVHDRHRQAIAKAEEDSMSRETSDEVRQYLRVKHQRQRQDLEDRVRKTERELTAIVDGDRSVFDSIAMVPNLDQHEPDLDGVQGLVREFAVECNQVMNSVQERQQQAKQVRDSAFYQV